MILRATHRTVYTYAAESRDSHNEVRLAPLTDYAQTCRSFSLLVEPATSIHSYEEPGGTVHYFAVRPPHSQLAIEARMEVESRLVNPFEGLNFVEPDWSFYRLDRVIQEFAEFLSPSSFVSIGNEVRGIAKAVRDLEDVTVALFLRRLTAWIYREFEYDPDATHVHSKLAEVLDGRAGVCQDFAHLMIACCRAQGIPSRYVGGYLYVEGDDELRGRQATHAWVDCLMPDGRWLSLDPTNDLLANDRYIRVHTGRDYGEVAPTSGVYVGPAAVSLDVSVNVERMDVSTPVG